MTVPGTAPESACVQLPGMGVVVARRGLPDSSQTIESLHGR
jgi:hypothetical protein